VSLSVAQLREHVETDLSEDALARIKAAEDEAIVTRAGSASSETEYMDALGHREIRLRRDAASITTAATRAHPDEDEVELAADDYRFEPPRTLVRLGNGTNGASGWLGRVRIVYVPDVDASLRDRVLIDLVKLAIEYRGLKAESAGDTSQTHAEYTAERERVLSQLDGRRSLLA
jgi:hypothetical protein